MRPKYKVAFQITGYAKVASFGLLDLDGMLLCNIPTAMMNEQCIINFAYIAADWSFGSPSAPSLLTAVSGKQIRVSHGHSELAKVRFSRTISNTKTITADGIASLEWWIRSVGIPQHNINLINYVVVDIINVIGFKRGQFCMDIG